MKAATRRALARLAHLRKLEQDRRRAVMAAARAEHDRLLTEEQDLLAELADPPAEVVADYRLMLAHAEDMEIRIRTVRENLARSAETLARLEGELLRARGELALLDRVAGK